MQKEVSLDLESVTDHKYTILKIKVKTLDHFKGQLPEYKSKGASGFDIQACLRESIKLKRGERSLIPTGLSFEIPVGFELQSRPRSGLAIKQGLTVLNSPGTIDSDYRGEVKIILINNGQDECVIHDQERIAQMVLCPVYQAHFVKSESLSETERGGGGFGSTGL